MTQPLVSIVIPVFNVERHLRQCLDSVLRQTLKEWECICIDDGSPDGSGAILDEYGNKDARFKIIHQRNRGVSMETPYPPSGNMRDEYAVTEKSFSGAALVDVSIWAKLFSVETIRAHQIHFAPELKVSEDMEFSTRMLCHSRRVSIIRKPLYHYRAGHESSIMNNIVRGRMKTSDFINSINAIYRLYRCVPSGLERGECRERITGTLRRALSGKNFYRQIIRQLDHKDQAAIAASTSFPYMNYLRRGKKLASLQMILRHLRMQFGLGTRLQALSNAVRNSFKS